MNQLVLSLGLEDWKPALAAMLLPPVPFLLLMLWGAARLRRHPRSGWALVLLGAACQWMAATEALAALIERSVNRPPPVLGPEQVTALRQQPHTAIVVLGGGRVARSLEYGRSDMKPRTAERLRYGIHLARQTGLPLAVTGGKHTREPGESEAELAARVARDAYQQPLRWEERQARDTRENALFTVPMLQRDGIRHIVLVTQGYHMQRALRHFEQAAAAGGGSLRITPAPMDMTPDGELQLLDWLPSLRGVEKNLLHAHELLGRLAGA